jgi:hypothetical protein
MGSVNRFRLVAVLAASILATSAYATNPPPASNGGEANASATSHAVGIGVGGKGGEGGNAQSVAAGGAGGSASSSQQQSAQGGAGGSGGDASNQGNSLSVNHEDRLQAPGVWAPPVYASGPCTSGWSAGLSIPGGALSGGRGKPDPGCERRELARVLTPLAPDLALRLLCHDPMLAEIVDAEECIFVPQPSVTHDYATRDEVEQLRKDSAAAIDRAFKQSQAK